MKSTSSFLTSIINKIIAIESKDKRIQYVTIYAILGIIGIVMVILLIIMYFKLKNRKKQQQIPSGNAP